VAGVPGDERQLLLERPGQEQVVGIHREQPLAPRLARRPVPRGAGAPVLLMEHVDPLVAPLVRARERERPVAGAVVHDDRLPVGRRLGEHGVERPAERALGVEGRDEDGDGDSVHAGAPGSGRRAVIGRGRPAP
jgi:hypothetical protein